MRIKISIVVVLALSLFLAAVAAAGPPARRVSGGGKLDLADRYYTVGLVVKIDGEGVVTGQGEFHNHSAEPWSSHWIPYCLSVNGDTAWISFTTVRTNFPDYEPDYADAMLQLQVTEEGTWMSPSIPTAWFPDLKLSDDCNDQPDLFSVESNVWTKGRFKIR